MQALRELLKEWWSYCRTCRAVVALCPHCNNSSCNGGGCSYCHMIFCLVNRLDPEDLPTPNELEGADPLPKL